MADAAPGAADADARRFLTFRVAERLYALPAEEVSEVIRMPAYARVPLSPRSLLGVANLRGSVSPLASVRALLGQGEAQSSPDARAIVLGGAAAVALAVDKVEGLVRLDAKSIETGHAALVAETGERLRGAFKDRGRGTVTKVLDIRSLLEADFTQAPRPARAGRAAGRYEAQATAEAAADEVMLVTFMAGGQEFAFNVAAVEEILAIPAGMAGAPGSEALVLGVAAVRDRLLPLLSLCGLLGFVDSGADGVSGKVMVVSVAGMRVGLVVDRTRSIVRMPASAIDPTPPVLAARAGGESRIEAIARAEGGGRLISILDPASLFSGEVMQRLAGATEAEGKTVESEGASGADESQFLVFRLGEEEFGLPIAAVDEVARAPERITRVPKTPKFLEGVINLRGEVLPVVDQRRRFGLPPLAGDRQRQRLVVVRCDGRRAGLIVDGVADVLRAPAERIAPAPDMTGEVQRLVHGVANFDGGRLVLLLDPGELLSRTERGLLERFEARTPTSAS